MKPTELLSPAELYALHHYEHCGIVLRRDDPVDVDPEYGYHYAEAPTITYDAVLAELAHDALVALMETV